MIVIDDGSTDRSLEIIRGFGEKIHWESGSNKGGCAARNRGIELAQGDYFQFLDANDLIHPEKIAIQLPYLLGKNYNAANSCLRRFSGDSYNWPLLRPKPELTPNPLHLPGFEFLLKRYLNEIEVPLEGRSLMHCWLLPRSLVEAVGPWDEQLAMAQDCDYFDRVCVLSEEVIYLPRLLAQYRVANRQWAEDHMSWPHVGQQHVDFYSAVSSSQRTRQAALSL